MFAAIHHECHDRMTTGWGKGRWYLGEVTTPQVKWGCWRWQERRWWPSLFTKPRPNDPRERRTPMIPAWRWQGWFLDEVSPPPNDSWERSPWRERQATGIVIMQWWRLTSIVSRSEYSRTETIVYSDCHGLNRDSGEHRQTQRSWMQRIARTKRLPD